MILTICGCAHNKPSASLVYFPPPPAKPRFVHLISFNRLHDLVRPRADWRDFYRGTGPSPAVSVPAGIDYRDNTLYICDTAQNLIHKWNLQSGVASIIGQDSDARLGEPVDVAVGADGTVYVADSGHGEIVAFDQAGTRVRGFAPPDRSSFRPVSLTVSDTRIYATDVIAHTVDVFATDGTYLVCCGGPGTGQGKFYFPTGIAIAPQGQLCVADMMNVRLQVMDSSCRPIRAIGQAGNRYGDLGKPKHLAVGPDGVVFVADPGFGRIQLFHTDGRFLMLAGSDEDGPASTLMPMGVAVAESLPESLAALVPAGFRANYFVFVTNTIGSRRMGLFAVGAPSNP